MLKKICVVRHLIFKIDVTYRDDEAINNVNDNIEVDNSLEDDGGANVDNAISIQFDITMTQSIQCYSHWSRINPLALDLISHMNLCNQDLLASSE